MDFNNFDNYKEIEQSLNTLYKSKKYDFTESSISNGLLDDLIQSGYVAIFNQDYEIKPLYITALIFKQAGYNGINLDLFSFFIDIPNILSVTNNHIHTLQKHLEGKQLITSALKEPYNHVEEGMLTKGFPIEDGYKISGIKSFVENYNQATSILFSFQTSEGIKLALINKERLKHLDHVTTSSKILSQIHFKDVEVNFKEIIEINNVLEVLNHIELSQKLMRSMFLEGVTKKMMELTSAYTADRKQFDRPIATFQAVSHRAASMFIDQECLHLINKQALYSLAEKRNDMENHILSAKAWSADVAHNSSYSAQHLHGGMGVSKEYDLWKYCLLAKEHEIMNDSRTVALNKLGKNITLNQ